MKILVVDDSLFCRKIVKAQLEEKIPGVEILYAANGDEGYDMYRREKPALTILDMLMPGKNGLEVLELIKRDDEAARVAILSADVQKFTREEVLRRGAHHRHRRRLRSDEQRPPLQDGQEA